MTIDSLRVHAAAEPRPVVGRELVLYWMQTTMRARDNLALEFAVEQANQLRLPLLVYHGLRHDYPWANDRIHSFILESVVDLYRDFAAREIGYAFYLEREGDDRAARRDAGLPSPLLALASRAAVVVSGRFPDLYHPGSDPGPATEGRHSGHRDRRRHHRAAPLPRSRIPHGSGHPSPSGCGASRLSSDGR